MDLQERLNQKGLRLTHPRKVVMSILNEAQVPLSPQSIHQRAVDQDEDIGLVSVYRTLDLLAELALVSRVHGKDDCHGYVLSSPGHHHHLVCRECERAIEFTGEDDLSTLLQRIQGQTGFRVDGHLLQLYGLCPDCQNHQNNKE
ncbi:transcriptional repressor [bacterium]|nr:transcriptional repressor [bacterium]